MSSCLQPQSLNMGRDAPHGCHLFCVQKKLNPIQFSVLMQPSQWRMCFSLAGGRGKRKHPVGKGKFVPLSLGCTVASSALGSWLDWALSPLRLAKSSGGVSWHSYARAFGLYSGVTDCLLKGCPAAVMEECTYIKHKNACINANCRLIIYLPPPNPACKNSPEVFASGFVLNGILLHEYSLVVC